MTYQNIDSNPVFQELFFFIDQSSEFFSSQIKKSRHLTLGPIKVFNAVDKKEE
jgi:hypothetical protein